MNIELIIFFFIFIVSTEIIFFKFTRGTGECFLQEKIVSIFCGGIAAVLLFGFPCILSNAPEVASGAPLGPIVYYWYYGIIGSVALFFLLNYKIHKWLEKNGI